MSKLIGYAEARKVDAVLNGLLEKYPIDKSSCHEWRTLCRTVKTSLSLINGRIRQVEQAKNLRRRWDD